MHDDVDAVLPSERYGHGNDLSFTESVAVYDIDGAVWPNQRYGD